MGLECSNQANPGVSGTPLEKGANGLAAGDAELTR
jgi:hypothetical protein